MFKNNLFLALLLCSSTLVAQLTIDANNFTPVVGDSFHYYRMLDTAQAFDFSASGTHQVWDLRNYSLDSSEAFLQVVMPMDSARWAVNSSANLLIRESSSFNVETDHYYELSNAGLAYYGYYFSVQGQEYQYLFSDPLENVVFPMSYNSTFSETVQGAYIQLPNTVFNRDSGTVQLHADAYGTLIMPSGNAHAVLKQSSTLAIINTSFNGTVSIILQTRVRFYDGVTHTHLCEYVHQTVDGLSTSSSLEMLREADIETGLQPLESRGKKLQFYPNPVAHQLFLEQLEGPVEVAIYQLDGQLLLQTNVDPINNSINLNDLVKGAYLLRYKFDNQWFSEVFMKE